MALQDIATVDISLETSTVSEAGFGVPVFLGAHRFFTERIRSYSSTTEAQADLPSGSDELKAVTQAFSQDISPSQVKVGRRETDSTVYTAIAPSAIGQVYSISITGTNDTTVEASFTTATGSEPATTVVSDLVSDLGSIPGVTIVDNTDGTFTVSPATAADDYSVSNIARLTEAHTVTESAADLVSAVETVDNDFYFVAAHDHSESFVLAMAAAIETRSKQYFVSVSGATNYAALSVPAASGDILGKLKDGNYFRTSGWYHQLADTDFPEMQFISLAAPSIPGSKIWANNRVAGGVTFSQNTDGNALTRTQRNNIYNKNANLIQRVGGIDISRIGKVAADEYIDIIRDRDFLEARITEALQNKLINSPKIPYTDSGINSVRGTVTSVLDRNVTTPTTPSILKSVNPYTTDFPRAIDVSFADMSNRILNASFVAFLANAIQIVKITGRLTFDNMA